MPDINMTTETVQYQDNPSALVFDINANAGTVTGNRALSNRFIITFLSSPITPMAFGYGGDAVAAMTSAPNGATTQSLIASAQSACSQTVANIINDQSDITDPTERIVSATVVSLIQDGVNDALTIELVPEQYDAGITEDYLLTLLI